MSSTTTTTTTVMDRRTYWCHECDMSISLIPTTTTSLCPHCNSDFLEELDSPITFHNSSNPNPNNHHDSNQLLFPSSDFQFPSETPSDALDNPRIHHRVIRQFFISNHHFLDSDPSAVAPATTSRLHSPASKAAIESIPSVKITTASVEICAVCKDQFVIDDETKELPCKHMYHTDCIVPWLSMRNSCPVCRFQMPVDPVEGCDSKVRRRSRSRVLRLGDLVDDDNDDDVEELLGFGLRHLARRYRLVSPMRVPREPVGEVDEPEVLFSPTQIGEEAQVDVEHDSGRTNSVETVSSWPSWPVDGGEIDTRVNDDDHDVVMS